jgi:hypothetical protein
MRVGGLNMKGVFTRTPKRAAHVLREFWVLRAGVALEAALAR